MYYSKFVVYSTERLWRVRRDRRIPLCVPSSIVPMRPTISHFLRTFMGLIKKLQQFSDLLQKLFEYRSNVDQT